VLYTRLDCFFFLSLITSVFFLSFQRIYFSRILWSERDGKKIILAYLFHLHWFCFWFFLLNIYKNLYEWCVSIFARGPKTWQLKIYFDSFSLQVMSLFLENHFLYNRLCFEWFEYRRLKANVVQARKCLLRLK
jgi:hypothetical protein